MPELGTAQPQLVYSFSIVQLESKLNTKLRFNTTTHPHPQLLLILFWAQWEAKMKASLRLGI